MNLGGGGSHAMHDRSLSGIHQAAGLAWRVQDGFIHMPGGLEGVAGRLGSVGPSPCSLRASPCVLPSLIFLHGSSGLKRECSQRPGVDAAVSSWHPLCSLG